MSLYQELKEHRQVFSLSFPQVFVTFRKMTIEESRIFEKVQLLYGSLVVLEAENEIFTDICIDVTVYRGEDNIGTTAPPEELNAGIVGSVVAVSYHLSQLGDHQQVNSSLSAIRSYAAKDFYMQTKLIILKAFPKLDPSDVDRLDVSKVLEYAICAERILDLEENIQAIPAKQGSQ